MREYIAIVRVSRTGLRDENLRSPDWQLEQIEAWAKAKGVTIARVIKEIDVSGGTTNRPALRKARAAVLNGEAGGLVAAYLSRFSRNTAEGLTLVRDVLSAGADFAALDCPFDLASPEGQQMLTFRLAEATYERDRAKRNFAKGVEGAIARGVHLTEAFGYRKGTDGVLIIDPLEGPWVPRIYAWRIDGDSYQVIADRLNAEGVKPHRYSNRRDGKATKRTMADRWTYAKVKGVLENRVYLGEARSGEFINPTAHEPLIDPATFAKVEAMRDIRPRRGKAEYELSGLLRCAGCGARIKGTTTTKGDKVYRYYDADPANCKCGGKVRAEALEAAVRSLFADVSRGLRAYALERVDGLDAAMVALHNAEATRSAVASDMELYALDRDAHREAVAAAAAAVRNARSAVQVARQRVTGVSATDDDLDNWASLPIADRRRFLAEAFEVIWIAADRTGWAPVGRGELTDPDRVAGDFLALA